MSAGTLYAAAVGLDGSLWMWGYGGHGNLGLGKAVRQTPRPTRVQTTPAPPGATVRSKAEEIMS